MKAPTRVGDVMSHPVITATPQTGFQHLVDLLWENAVSAVPIVDEHGGPLGVVSEDDLLAKERAQAAVRGPAHAEPGRPDTEENRARATCARDLMTAPVATIAADAPLAVAARRMHDAAVKRLVVVDRKGRTVGIVSRRDLLRPYGATDGEIRARIEEEIDARATWSDVSTVAVAVTDGIVRVRGEVERRSDALVILALARGVEGVVGVEDRLQCRIEDIAGDHS